MAVSKKSIQAVRKPSPTPHSVFQQLQKNMLSSLSMSKAAISHPGTLGGATEEKWLDLFQRYLPERYRAERGHVMDSKGGMSDQIDVIIFDRHFTPFLFNDEGVYYIPAESVYAVIEVKQSLNKHEVGYAGDKIASVRKLHRTSVPIPHAGGVYPAKELFHIMGGIVTTSVDWKGGLGKEFQLALASNGDDARVDFGCVLDTGAFDVEFIDDQLVTHVDDSNILLTFIMKLLDKLQAKASVPALDYKSYCEIGQ